MHNLTALIASILLSGCTTYHAVLISVEDQNGAAVPNASVQVAPSYFFNPTDERFLMIGAYDILEPFPGRGGFGITDELGEVTLKIVDGNPSALTVLAPNQQRWQGIIELTRQRMVNVTAPTMTNTDLQVTAKRN